MEVVKLGKEGQVSIPESILNQLGLQSETMLLVEMTADGGILLYPAGAYPIEIYTEERIKEFLDRDRLTPQEVGQVQLLVSDVEQ